MLIWCWAYECGTVQVCIDTVLLNNRDDQIDQKSFRLFFPPRFQLTLLIYKTLTLSLDGILTYSPQAVVSLLTLLSKAWVVGTAWWRTCVPLRSKCGQHRPSLLTFLRATRV